MATKPDKPLTAAKESFAAAVRCVTVRYGDGVARYVAGYYLAHSSRHWNDEAFREARKQIEELLLDE